MENERRKDNKSRECIGSEELDNYEVADEQSYVRNDDNEQVESEDEIEMENNPSQL